MNFKFVLLISILVSTFFFYGCSDDKEAKKTSTSYKKVVEKKKIEKPKIEKHVVPKKKEVVPKKKTVVKKVVKKKPRYIATKGWRIAKVRLAKGGYHIYEVMARPVTQNEFKKNASNISMSNINVEKAEAFCMKFANANLAKEFVFSSTIKNLKRPSKGIKRELLTPYDEEDDAIYFRKGKIRETLDTKIFLYDWNKKTYKATSKLFKSKTTTFRCMRRKH